MARTSIPTLSINEALDILSRLGSAAPPPTAGRIAEVAALLQSLAEDNAYLNTLLVEGIPSDRPPQPARDVPPAPADKTITDELRSAVAAADTPLSIELFTGLSNALRPPLIAIRGRAELVQAGLLGQITSEQDLWLQAIHENTERGFAVLETVQGMIGLHTGQARFDPVNFISTDLLTEAWERIRDKVRPFGHAVTIQAPDVVPLATGDFYQSLIVLTDLLDNAIRYTPPGGQIRMSVDSLGTHVLFSVADNGIGLTPDDLERVGRPFWRGEHNRLVRQHVGTGLRLYLAKQILAAQGGELIFSGEPGLGSTFSFTLPAPV